MTQETKETTKEAAKKLVIRDGFNVISDGSQKTVNQTDPVLQLELATEEYSKQFVNKRPILTKGKDDREESMDTKHFKEILQTVDNFVSYKFDEEKLLDWVDSHYIRAFSDDKETKDTQLGYNKALSQLADFLGFEFVTYTKMVGKINKPVENKIITDGDIT